MSPLTGKIALVTGGSRGIGLATARALLTQGASVAITATNQARLNAAATELSAQAASGRILAIAAPRRLATHPEVPTSAEAGGPSGYEVESWTGFLAPRGTPPELVRLISGQIAAAVADPELQERYRNLGLVPVSSSSAEMAQMIRDNLERNGDLVKRAAIQPE